MLSSFLLNKKKKDKKLEDSDKNFDGSILKSSLNGLVIRNKDFRKTLEKKYPTLNSEDDRLVLIDILKRENKTKKE